MQYRILDRSCVSLSELCLGTMNFGAPTDENHAVRIVRCVDACSRE